VVAAVFADHPAAQSVRTALVKDGFPTDRVELTSREELGQVRIEPASGVPEKLAQYFEQLFPQAHGRQAVLRLSQAVLDGHAVVAVHPRGEVETQRAIELLNHSDPVEFTVADLNNQPLERAATREESTPWSWIGRVMVAPLAPDR